jgi:hypothetical protein
MEGSRLKLRDSSRSRNNTTSHLPDAHPLILSLSKDATILLDKADGSTL